MREIKPMSNADVAEWERSIQPTDTFQADVSWPLPAKPKYILEAVGKIIRYDANGVELPEVEA